MKKIIIIILFISIITGCNNMRNTPTNKVEDFLGKYQRLDQNVIQDLKNVIKKESQMDEEEKREYQALLEKQYQNLSYKIKKEEIIDKTAIVEVEIEVFDYQTAIHNSKKYYQNHIEEFVEKRETQNLEDIDTNKKYIDYKISEMKKVNTRIKENISFQLVLEKGKWKIKELNKEDLSKLHGLYE